MKSRFLFLKKKDRVNFRKLSEKQKRQKGKSPRKAQIELDNNLDQILYENLRAARQQMAKKRRVPAYVIFHDKTLIELAKVRPKNFEDMLEISGIGKAKLKKFGQTLLDVILAA